MRKDFVQREFGGVVPQQSFDRCAFLVSPAASGIARAALGAAGKNPEIHVYDGAPHAFNADYRPSYRKDAAADGWRRMLDWFRQHGA